MGLTDAIGIDELLTSKCGLNLHILNGTDVRRAQVLKGNLSPMIAIQLLLEGKATTPLTAIEVED